MEDQTKTKILGMSEPRGWDHNAKENLKKVIGDDENGLQLSLHKLTDHFHYFVYIYITYI